MEKKFIVPASTFIAGIVIWVILILVNEENGSSPLMESVLGFTSGGLIFFSAYRCSRIGGPRFGIVFRTMVLFSLAVLSYFFIGNVSAFILLASGIATGILIFKVSDIEKTGSLA